MRSPRPMRTRRLCGVGDGIGAGFSRRIRQQKSAGKEKTG